MKNIIFLDVDGVLNSCGHEEYNNHSVEIIPELVERVAHIYKTCDAEIILSSSWRNMQQNGTTYNDLVDALASQGMVISGHTPTIEYDRPREIRKWLDNNQCKNFVSLDDDFTYEQYEKYGIADHLVKTSIYAHTRDTGGLTKECMERALAILNGDFTTPRINADLPCFCVDRHDYMD